MNFPTLLHITTGIILLLAVSLSSCADRQRYAEGRAAAPPGEEKTDSSCSYFYFLWGSDAEYKESYAEALEAYEKALICDPSAEYIAEKIPVLLIQLSRFEEATAWLEDYIARKPEKTVQRFMLARLKIQEGKEDQAIQLYEEALGLEPENNNIRLRLGLLYGKKGDVEVAERIFQDILERDPSSYFAHLYLARLNARVGRLENADRYYQEALEINWSKELGFELAEFYNLRRQFDKAQTIYGDILCKDEKDERAALGMVQTYLFLQDGESALQELTRIREFTNNPERIDLIRSQILINIGEVKRAKDILIELLQENQFSQANYLLGVIYYEEMEFDNALQVLRKIAPSSPEYREATILQVRILDENKDPAQAIELLREQVAQETTRMPAFYSLLASLYEQYGKANDALRTLADGLKIYVDNESLMYEYAILLETTSQHEKAMELMKKLLLLNPNHADALNFIGYSWADRDIHLQEAYTYITKALEIKPNSGYILDSLGWVYYRMGSYENARKELERAVLLEPEDPYIYEHLGDTYRALGQRDKALENYRKSLEFLRDSDKKNSIMEKIDDLNEQK